MALKESYYRPNCNLPVTSTVGQNSITGECWETPVVRAKLKKMRKNIFLTSNLYIKGLCSMNGPKAVHSFLFMRKLGKM